VKKVLAGFQVCLICGVAFAQSNTPKYSNEFLTLGVGARALGMAGAYTSITSDVLSGYWNPAGLGELQYPYEISLMHSQYFAGIANYDYAAFATKVDSLSTIAVSIIRFGVDDIPDTRFLYDANGALNYNNIQFFSAVDYAFILSYARKMNALAGINIGVSVKIIHRSAGNFAKAWGYGLDIGLKKQMKDLSLGLMLKDLTGTYNIWSHNTSLVADIYTLTGNVIPENSIEITLPRAILGASYLFTVKEDFTILTSLDFEMTFDGKRNTLIQGDRVSIDPRAGLELGYIDKFFVRFGVGQIQEIEDFDRSTYRSFQPTFGVGVKLANVKIDYALADIGDQAESPYSNIISLQIGFNNKK